jgi:hypothetical protein
MHPEISGSWHRNDVSIRRTIDLQRTKAMKYHAKAERLRKQREKAEALRQRTELSSAPGEHCEGPADSGATEETGEERSAHDETDTIAACEMEDLFGDEEMAGVADEIRANSAVFEDDEDCEENADGEI